MHEKSPLRTLVDLISDAVTKIDEIYSSSGLRFPALDDNFDFKQSVDALLLGPDVSKNVSVVVAAAEQLCVSLKHPGTTVLELATAHFKSSCIQTVVVTSVPEILREAGPAGLHVNEIAKKNGLDSPKLSRILRLLATNHVFTEVSPNVFTNNRLSSILDTLKPSSAVLSVNFVPPVDKYSNSNGLAAMSEFFSGTVMKSSTYMTDNLVDPRTAHSDEPADSPFNLALNTRDPYYTWLCKPENKHHRAAFDAGMPAISVSEGEFSILRGFPWESLADGSEIVDVGGGLGSISLAIAKKFPSLKFVIQDLFLDRTEQYWEERLPGSFASGRVITQKHDFFTQQPVKDADIFLFRGTVHNWPDHLAIVMLKQLRAAAVPGKTRLLMAENIVGYCCKGIIPEAEGIPGASPPAAPEPVLQNFGRATEFTNGLDLLMLTLLHGQERTLGDHLYITKQSGWKIIRIYSPTASVFHHILAEAV